MCLKRKENKTVNYLSLTLKINQFSISFFTVHNSPIDKNISIFN